MAIKTGDYLRNGNSVRAICQPNYYGFIYVEFAPGLDAREASDTPNQLAKWGKPITEAEAQALVPDMDERLADLENDAQVKALRSACDYALLAAPADKFERVAEMRGYKLTKVD